MGSFLILLASGAFAVGMEGLMIAGLLPTIAAHLRIGLPQAGTLVTAFSLSYALCAPLAAALTARFERRVILVGAMALFAFGNLACALAPDFALLIAARLITAVAAGLYMPAAMAYAAAAVPGHRRGRALGLVGGGITAALVLGVPFGTWIGTVGTWRWPFLVVAGLAATAGTAMALRLPRRNGSPGASIGQRLAVLGVGRIRTTLAATVLWSTGAFTVYTFIATVVAQAVGVGADLLPPIMLAWGLAASLGSIGGGWAVDRWGARRIAMLGLVLAGLSTAALALLSAAPLPALALLMLWAVAGWSVNPAQQARLVAASPAHAQISLSFHASGIYLGSALGSLLGGLAISAGHAPLIGVAGALCELAALTLLTLSRWQVVPETGPLLATPNPSLE